jgi:hypothetical protein
MAFEFDFALCHGWCPSRAVWFDKIEPLETPMKESKNEPVHSLAQHTPVRKVYDRQTRT